MKPILYLAAACLLVSNSVEAQLYKSVDKNGRVTYSDSPTPNAVQTRSFARSDSASGENLPYALNQVTKNNPVILYTADNCDPCRQARDYLRTRGVPFREKTISSNADVKRFSELYPNVLLPFATVGRDRLSGFNMDQWSRSLTAASYPEKSSLPANYAGPQPVALVPEQVARTEIRPQLRAEPAATQPTLTVAPQTANASPPGFRF